MRKEAKIFKTTDPDEVEEDDEDNVDASENIEPAEQEFEVKEILYERIDKGELQYRVFWEGYDINDSTWEPAENLAKCHEVLQAYEDKKERERIWLEEHESAEKRKKRRRRKRQQREERERQREQEKSPSPDPRRDERSWRERSKSEEIFPEPPKKKKGDKSRPQPKKEKREQVLAEFQEEHQAKKKKKKLRQLKDQPAEPNKKRDRFVEENDCSSVVERKKKKRKIRVADSDDEGKVFYSRLIQEGTPQKKARVVDSGESDSENIEKPKDVSPPVSVSSRETSPVEGAHLPPSEDIIPNKVLFAELFGDSSSSENGSPRNTASVAKKPLPPSDSSHLPQRNPSKVLPPPPPNIPAPVTTPPVQPPRSAPPRPPVVPPPIAPVAPPEDSRLEAAIQRDRLRVESTTKLIALNEVRPPPRTKAYIAPASSRMRPVPIEPILPPSTLRRNNITGLPINQRCIKSVTTPQRTPPSNTPFVPPEQGPPRPIPSIIRPVPPQNNPPLRIANQPRPPLSLNKASHTPPHTSPQQLNRTPIPSNRTPTTGAAFFPTPPDSPRRNSGFKPSTKLHNTPDKDHNRKGIEEVPNDKTRRRLEDPRKNNGGPTKVPQNKPTPKPNITVTNKTVRVGNPPRTDKTPIQTREQIPVKPRKIVEPIQKSASVLPTVPKDIQRPRPNLPCETVPASSVPKSSRLPPAEPSALPVGTSPSERSVESAPSDPRKKPPSVLAKSTTQPSNLTVPTPQVPPPPPPPPPPPQVLATVNLNLPLLNQAFVNAVRPCNQRPLLPYSQASALFQPSVMNQSYGFPHPHQQPPLTNQHSFSLSFNQFYQPTLNFVGPHSMMANGPYSDSPYLFASNPFSLDGPIHPLPPQQQMVDNFGMMAPQHSSHLIQQPVVNGFGVMQTSFHGLPPVAPSVHQENLHVLTSCSDIPLPVSPPKPPVCPKPAPPPPPPTPVKRVERVKEMDEGEIVDDNASDSDMDMSISLDVEGSSGNTRNITELHRPDFEPISDPEDGELSDDETPALRIDLEPISDAEDDQAPMATTVPTAEPEPTVPTKETAELSEKEVAVAVWLKDSTAEQSRKLEREDTVEEVSVPERSWVPFEYFSDRPLAKLKEVVCAIEDDRFMVELEGSVTRTLITLTDMQKYYFTELIAYLQRFQKEPAANDFAFRSSKYYVRQQGLL